MPPFSQEWASLQWKPRLSYPEAIQPLKSTAMHYFSPLMHHPCLPQNMARTMALREEGNEAQVRTPSIKALWWGVDRQKHVARWCCRTTTKALGFRLWTSCSWNYFSFYLNHCCTIFFFFLVFQLVKDHSPNRHSVISVISHICSSLLLGTRECQCLCFEVGSHADQAGFKLAL